VATAWVTNATTWAFLLMSCASFGWQATALHKLTKMRTPAPDEASCRVYRGLVRTSAWRVAATVLYVGVGINGVFFHVTYVTFSVFCVVQVVWQLNASADLRLRRFLGNR
jgi:hypothetical protein